MHIMHTRIGEGDGATLHIRHLEPAFARPADHIVDFSNQIVKRAMAQIANNRISQATIRIHGDTNIDRAIADDLVVDPNAVHVRGGLQRPGNGRYEQMREADTRTASKVVKLSSKGEQRADFNIDVEIEMRNIAFCRNQPGGHRPFVCRRRGTGNHGSACGGIACDNRPRSGCRHPHVVGKDASIGAGAGDLAQRNATVARNAPRQRRCPDETTLGGAGDCLHDGVPAGRSRYRCR